MHHPCGRSENDGLHQRCGFLVSIRTIAIYRLTRDGRHFPDFLCEKINRVGERCTSYDNDLHMERFVTPTEGWAERMGDKLCVPTQWALMLIDLLVDKEGVVLMSGVVGVSERTARDLEFKGVYHYAFKDQPDGIIAAIEQHFRNSMVDVRKRLDATHERHYAAPDADQEVNVRNGCAVSAFLWSCIGHLSEVATSSLCGFCGRRFTGGIRQRPACGPRSELDHCTSGA